MLKAFSLDYREEGRVERGQGRVEVQDEREKGRGRVSVSSSLSY
jgi:hypothetical protein